MIHHDFANSSRKGYLDDLRSVECDSDLQICTSKLHPTGEYLTKVRESVQNIN